MRTDPAGSLEARHARAEVLVATTWHCNLRCSYCFVQQQSLAAVDRPMSPALAARVIDALDAGLPDVESIGVHLYGGEPLTNLPAMEALVQRAAGKPAGRFRFAITTNGTCASPRVLELLEAGRFEVVLSIDGPAEVHDACRRTAGGAPTHAQVLAFLDAVLSHTHCGVRGSAVVRSGWRLAAACAYLRALPVHAIKAQAVRLPAGSPYALSAAEQQAYLDDLSVLGRQVIDEIAAGRVPRDDRFSARVLQLLAGVTRDSFCAAGTTGFGITPDGQVLPCVLLDASTRLGHVDDPPESWRAAGRRWLAARPHRSQCDSCAALPLCGGGCPAMTPLCGDDECELVRANCAVARNIFNHFRDDPTRLLVLAGIT